MEQVKEKQLDTFFARLLNDSKDRMSVAIENEMAAENEPLDLCSTLNHFIDLGVQFEVSGEKFVINDTREVLKRSDLQFLKIHYSDVLCTLQQSLLTKHLFSHSAELLENFGFEIEEQQSLISTIHQNPFVIYQSAVKDVTRKWFEFLVEMHFLEGNQGN